MEWLIIIAVLWGVYAYLYRTTEKHEGSPRLTVLDMDKLYTPSSKPIVRPKTEFVKPYDQYMTAEAKRDYLLSVRWKIKRNAVFTRDDNTCQSCGSTEQLECHHIDYSMLGDEPLEHLITLCGGSNGCHQKIHDLLGYSRTTIYSLSSLKNLPKREFL